MTTNAQHTPYTERIAELISQRRVARSKYLDDALAAAQCRQEGSLRAKAEDADLLAADEAALNKLLSPDPHDAFVVAQLQAAIAKAKGEA